MQSFEQLEYGHYYHLYNHGVGERDLFRTPDNYEYFLGLYDKYISPVADTFAWVLMPNHFHLLVRIKENIVYKYSNTDRSIDAVRFNEMKWQTIEKSPNLTASEGPVSVGEDSVNKGKVPQPHLHFSHLFNEYSKYFNIRHETRGALFERPFKRKLIDNDEYLKRVILYIHNNPVHHGFCSHPLEYAWSSYHTCTSVKPTKLKRGLVIGWFNNQEGFKLEHENEIEREEIERWLEKE
jgi:putative transposase